MIMLRSNRKFFCLSILLLIFISCEESKRTIQNAGKVITTLPRTISNRLSAPVDPCATIYNSPVSETDGNSCVSFDASNYAEGKSAAMASIANTLSSSQKKANFINFMAPIAVKIQQKTGLPASVIIAQAAHETGWGTSRLFARGNSAFGHSCWSRNEGETKRIQISASPPEYKEMRTKCNYSRPSNEGGFYLTFESMEDSVAAYVNNLLYNPRTARHYGGIRNTVNAALAEGRVASHEEVTRGLGSYAADRRYIPKINTTIADSALARFDNMNLCEGETGLGLQAPVNGCDQRIDDTSRIEEASRPVVTAPIVVTPTEPMPTPTPEPVVEEPLIIEDPNEVVEEVVLPPQEDCNISVDRTRVLAAIDNTNCISYPENAYLEGSAKDIAHIGKSLTINERKENFINYLAPIAVRIQLKTGLPASVIMSQAIHESAWGTSNLFEKGSAAFGHSCWRRDDGAFQRIQLASDPDEFKEIDVACNHPRPASEGGLYLTFDSFEDSVLAYANNLLYNPRTSNAYGNLRSIVNAARVEGQVANSIEVANALGSYATDPNYINKVKNTINANDLSRFDSMNICGEAPAEEQAQTSCNTKVDDSDREFDALLIDPATVNPNNQDPKRVGPR